MGRNDSSDSGTKEIIYLATIDIKARYSTSQCSVVMETDAFILMSKYSAQLTAWSHIMVYMDVQFTRTNKDPHKCPSLWTDPEHEEDENEVVVLNV